MKARAPAVPSRTVAAMACGMENFAASTVSGSAFLSAWPPGAASTTISAISSFFFCIRPRSSSVASTAEWA